MDHSNPTISQEEKEVKVIDAIHFGAHTLDEIQNALGSISFTKEEISKTIGKLVREEKLWMQEYRRPPRVSYYIAKI